MTFKFSMTKSTSESPTTARATRAQGPYSAGSTSPELGSPESAAGLQDATAEFILRHGRAPRVLCIGNVANNGYNNGKILARAGWDIDVLCYDYYHIMGCPEWEDADFEGDYGDPFNPAWQSVDLRGFRRPNWFVQGPRHLCVQYLLAKRENRPLMAAFYRAQLQHFQNPWMQHSLLFANRVYRVLTGRSVRLPVGKWLQSAWHSTKRAAIYAVTAPLSLIYDGLMGTLSLAVRAKRGLQSGWQRLLGRMPAPNAPLAWFMNQRRTVSERARMFGSVADALRWQAGQFAYLGRTARASCLSLLGQAETWLVGAINQVGRKVLGRLPRRIARPLAKTAFVSSQWLGSLRRTVLNSAAWVEQTAYRGLSLLLQALISILALPITLLKQLGILLFIVLPTFASRVARSLRSRRAARVSSRRSKPSLPENSSLALSPQLPLSNAFEVRMRTLIERFGEHFPERKDQLSTADMIGYQSITPEWQRLMSHYDLVVGYATDGIYPLLMGKRPYVAYEHGTIRSIPFETNPVGRCCALTYRMADAVVITNCDCDIAADKLQLDNHRFIPHPINEDWLDDDSWLAVQTELRERLQSDFIIFHPSRQHWEPERHPSWEKGNDFLIRGFARFVHEVCPTAAMVCVAWGKTLQQSKDLLAELGVADRVLWVEPMPTVRMTRYMRACDVIADQFFLGAFGGIMPKAMVYGRPTLIYLNEERHRWCFPEMPPICNTRTDDEVFEALRRLRVEPGYMQNLIDDGLRWYAKYHSSQLVASRFDDILRDVLLADDDESPSLDSTTSRELRRCA